MKIIKVLEALSIIASVVCAYFLVYFTQQGQVKFAMCFFALMGVGIALVCGFESVLREEYNTTLFKHDDNDQ